jgi:hypothetical protein
LSISWPLVAEPTPAILVLPPDVASLDEADAAIELWEHYSRKELDPVQRLTVQVMMAQRSDGLWAAATTGREMPRQNGKGDEIEVVELWGLVERGEAILHTVHDAVLLATQAQQRLLGVLEGHADLRKRVARRWLGTGQQMIEMRNGAVIWYRTRTNGGGRGVDNVDRVVMDEAQHATDEHAAAITPTLLANPNPQLNALGSAGIEGKSSWWWSQRRRALSPNPGRFGYVGHTAERLQLSAAGGVIQSSVDPHDRSLWIAANPAIAAGRGQGMPYLEEQLHRLGPLRFAREHLGVWDPDLGFEQDDALPGWAALADERSKLSGRVAFAVDVTPDRKWTSIAAAGRTDDGRWHLEVVDHQMGTSGAVARIKELRDRWSPVAVVLDPAGPAGSLLADLVAAGVDVRSATPREHGQACGALYDDVLEKRVVHLGDSLLNAAVGGARRRDVSDVWLWDRKKSDVDLSPLVAVTLARWAVAATPPEAEFFVY